MDRKDKKVWCRPQLGKDVGCWGVEKRDYVGAEC